MRRYYLIFSLIIGLLSPPALFAKTVGHLGLKPGSTEQLCLFTARECTKVIGGNYYPNGECLKKTGGSFSYDYRSQCPEAKSFAAVFEKNDSCLQKLNRDTLIFIADDWRGHSACSSQEAHFQIKKIKGKYVAKGDFYITFRTGGFAKNKTSVTLPDGVIDAFLSTLKTAPLPEGAYTPRIDKSDHYPSKVIIINIEDKTCYFSASQYDAPWGAIQAGTEYNINSAIPAQAFDILKPFLKTEKIQHEIDKLCNKYD